MTESRYYMNRFRIFTAVLAAASMLLLSSCFSFMTFQEMSGGVSTTSEYEYIPAPEYQQTTSVVIENTTAAQVTPETDPSAPADVPDSPAETTRPAQVTTEPSEETTEPANVQGEDYSSYTTAQIIDTYAAAVNKTRAYGGAFTAVKTEAFNAEITDAHPGGALTELLASNIVKLVGSEGQQTLSFSGGKAVDSEGVTVPVLLPQNGQFTLPVQGVSSAKISKSGDKTLIKITLIPETVAMGETPKYNSGAIGYLDTSDMDFKIITISRVDISYTGSVIDAVIRSDGYIESVTYTINMSTYAELSGMGITGYGTLEGAQTEKWEINL